MEMSIRITASLAPPVFQVIFEDLLRAQEEDKDPTYHEADHYKERHAQ